MLMSAVQNLTSALSFEHLESEIVAAHKFNNRLSTLA
jgi:hypothetical protein